MLHSWKKGKVSEFLFGIVVPSLVALLIIAVGMVSTPSLIGLKYPLLEAIVIVGVPMLIGYIAGALSKRSTSYRRMLTAGVIAGIMGALIVIFVGLFSPILGEASVSGVLLAFLPRVLAGVIVPFIARAFLRHGASQNKI